jgi:hypothetical protein
MFEIVVTLSITSRSLVWNVGSIEPFHNRHLEEEYRINAQNAARRDQFSRFQS